MNGFFERADVLETLRRVERHRLFDRLAEDHRYLGVQITGGSHLATRYPLYALHRLIAGEQLIHGSAQGVDIRAGIRAPHAILLWRGISGGDGPGAQGGLKRRVGHFDQPEIDQHHFPFRGNANIGRLNIAVQDRRLAIVQIGQCVGDLADPIDRFVNRHPLLAVKDGSQVLTLHEIHHQVLPLSGDREVIGHARQVRMRQVGQHRGFTRKLALRLVGGIQVFFNRARPAQVDIPGFVNGSKTTPAQLFLDAIAV